MLEEQVEVTRIDSQPVVNINPYSNARGAALYVEWLPGRKWRVGSGESDLLRLPLFIYLLPLLIDCSKATIRQPPHARGSAWSPNCIGFIICRNRSLNECLGYR